MNDNQIMPWKKVVTMTSHASFGRKIDELLLILVLYFQMFGIKIFGFIDLQIIVLFVVVLLYSKSSQLYIERKYFLSILLLMVLLGYSMLLFLISDNGSVFELLRIARALVSSVLLYIYFSFIPFCYQKVVRVIVLMIFLHAVFIVVEMMYPEFKIFMSGLLGNESVLGSLRAFGLTAAYDTAGAYLIMGMILSYYIWTRSENNIYILLVLFFCAAGFATGRTFMVIGALSFVLIMMHYIFASRFSSMKLFVLGAISVGFYLFFLYAFPVLYDAYMFVVGGGGINVGYHGSGYYVGTISTLMDQRIVPDSVAGTIFGTGATLIRSDIGYYKVVYTVGFVGVLMYFVYYIVLYSIFSYKISRYDMRMVLIPLFLIMLIYNYKMQVLLSRGFHEILVIMLFSMSKWRQYGCSSWVAVK